MKFRFFIHQLMLHHVVFLPSRQSDESEQYSVSVYRNEKTFCSCREKNFYLYWQLKFTAQVAIKNDIKPFKYEAQTALFKDPASTAQ